MKVITVAINKGGVGKTTTAINLLDYYTGMGYNCLGIDLDSQGNLTIAAGLTSFNHTSSEFFLLKNPYPVEQVINRNFDIVPADKSLLNIENMISSKYNSHSLLSKQLQQFTDYDVIIIDCSSHIDLISQNALVASDLIICPMMAEGFSVDGYHAMHQELMKIQEAGLNDHVHIAEIIINQYRKERPFHRVFFDYFDNIQIPLFTVPERMAVRESQYQFKNLFMEAPDNDATRAMSEAFDYIAQKYLSNGKTI